MYSAHPAPLDPIVTPIPFNIKPFDPRIELRFGPKIVIPMDQVFYINKLVFAFVNLRPVVPGHVLISSWRYARHIRDLTEVEMFEIFRVTQMISSVIGKYYKTENTQKAIQDGEHAG